MGIVDVAQTRLVQLTTDEPGCPGSTHERRSPMEEQTYYVQFLVLHEVEVAELDSLQAVDRAMQLLRPQARARIIYQRVLTAEGEIAADWDTALTVEEHALTDLGLKSGDQITRRR
jgi:hypothetical protein